MQRSTRTFLVVLITIVVIAAGTVFVAALGLSGSRVAHGSVLAIDLQGSFPEHDPNASLAALLGKPAMTMGQLLDALDHAAKDDRIEAVELSMGFLDLGWARAREIREAILELRKSGKPVHAFLEQGGDDGTYYVASAADEVRTMSTATLWLDGISAEVTFYAGALAKVGVRADLEQLGEYKNAADVMERTSMSDAHRESMNSLLDGLFDEIVGDLAVSLDKTPDDVKALISAGPYTAQQALDAGLVDDLAYRDEARMALDEEIEHGDAPRITLEEYVARLEPQRGDATIGIIYCVGSIMPGASSNGLFSGEVMGSDTIAEAIEEAVEEDHATALVLRVDSPGGSPVASDVIWRAVRRAQDAGVPVVVSMADVAASGGYWISMGADEVLAQPSTITGSIGIFGGKYVMADLNAKVDVTTEPLMRGANAAINSTLSEFTPEQRQWIRGELTAVYNQFLSKTADGRGFDSPEAVDAVARGRVWTGRQALELGLVDELGGLAEAVLAARRLADVETGSVSLRSYPRAPGLLESFLESGVSLPVSAVRHAVEAELVRDLPIDADALAVGRLLNQLQREGVLAYLPYRVLAH